MMPGALHGPELHTKMTIDNSTTRFSNRVANYVRFRPSYPPEVLRSLTDDFGLRSDHLVADIGSGTGIFTELLLDAGHTVYAVEPNTAMRDAAEQRLAHLSNFRSVRGTAEATTLPDHSVDWLVAAQAFHWFDVDRFREEALRILRPPSMAAILWNNRREDTPFLAAYETFLHEFAIDYAKVKHQNAEADGRIPRFFKDGPFVRRGFTNAQDCNFDALKGRTLSASFMPSAEHPRYETMIESLGRLFDQHARNGKVTIEYETCMYVAKAAYGA